MNNYFDEVLTTLLIFAKANQSTLSKSVLKIVNDPLYGFIKIPTELVFKLIEHPYFQRLRRIRQLGMTHLVYPGAHHTRFHHALGAMHLMGQAIDTLRSKGHRISDEEAESVTIAILLHDIGHGPFSHALEDSIVPGIRHEELSALFMDRLNEEFKGALSLALSIFRNQYPKRFLHQLVSSQLDMDRLDYLGRDSFFTGVSEGVISQDRIIKMLELHNDQLAIEEKGIYSIEKFIVARRLMYWQVYLHKTVVSAECLLINILRRAREVAMVDGNLFATPALKTFLTRNFVRENFIQEPGLLDIFAELDDSDITTSVKMWSKHQDRVLSELCTRLVNRKLYKILLRKDPFSSEYIHNLKKELLEKYHYKESELPFFLVEGTIVNNAYQSLNESILVVMKDGRVLDIADAADTLNIKSLSEPVSKYYICIPK